MEPEHEAPPTWIRRAVRKMFPAATPQLEDRESIWSIQKKDAKAFFLLVSVLWTAALVYIGYTTLNQPTAAWNNLAAEPGRQWWQNAGDFAIVVLGDFTNVGIGTAIVAMLLTRPATITVEIFMSLYQAMVNRFVIPVIEAHKAEGRAETQAKWEEWNKRRMEAEAKGVPFDEPPPSSQA